MPRVPDQEYIDAITALANSKKNQRFLNDSEHYAKLIADLMIGGAKEETLIYTGSLKESCFVDALKQARGSIKILVDNPEEASWVNRLNLPSVEMHTAKQPLGNHFFVVDRESFREERDHQRATAVANFKEPEFCKELKERFEQAW